MTETLKLKKIAAGSYATEDGRFTLTKDSSSYAKVLSRSPVDFGTDRFWTLTDTSGYMQWGFAPGRRHIVETNTLTEAKDLIASALKMQAMKERVAAQHAAQN